jgi:hypothetical protein
LFLPVPPYALNDITVMPIPGGYLLGRVVQGKSHGPWWEYLQTVRDRETAIQRARVLAAAQHARAWLYDDHFESIPPLKES